LKGEWEGEWGEWGFSILNTQNLLLKKQIPRIAERGTLC
jgi:hypothetical protein